MNCQQALYKNKRIKLKQWMQKLVSQFDINWGDSNHKTNKNFDSITEDRATLLFMIDTLNKHLVEIEGKPLRKTRQMLDDFSLEILKSNDQNLERVLFRWRQFFSSFRIDEYSYVLRTFDEFRSIIWDFVDQLSDELLSDDLLGDGLLSDGLFSEEQPGEDPREG